jgi:hypothetical protein
MSAFINMLLIVAMVRCSSLYLLGAALMRSGKVWRCCRTVSAKAVGKEQFKNVVSLGGGSHGVVVEPGGFGGFLNGQSVALIVGEAEDPEEESLEDGFTLFAFLVGQLKLGQLPDGALEIQVSLAIVF